MILPFIHPNNTLSKCISDDYLPKFSMIGHRGMGISNSIGKKSSLAENTILSFQTAAEKGANFVEFDVNLTKCRTPIVYHDFTLGLYVGENMIVPISVQDINFIQIKNALFKPQIRVKGFGNDYVPSGVQTLFVKEKGLKKSFSLENFGSAEILPITDYIPTLKEVFEKLDESVGFDVEIKYPLEEEKEYFGLTKVFERNFLVDHILKVIFDLGQKRKIFFSSFDPEVCCLLASKQTRYPVFFLTESGMTIYKDERCNSIENAIEFCIENGIHGIVTDCRPILKDTSLIDKCLKSKVPLMAYGSELSDPDTVKLLKEKGLIAAICDNVGGVIKNMK